MQQNHNKNGVAVGFALFAAECLLLDETAQQIVQLNDGLVDHIDVVDNGACTGEDAGQLVKDLTHVQECLVSVAVGNGGPPSR